MNAFRMLIIGLWLALASYTGVVIFKYGLNLLPIFFGQIRDVTWPGQFNADFLCFLLLSATWVGWRSGFGFSGTLLAIAALFGGAGFLLPYLLILSIQSRGDIGQLLLGPNRMTNR